MRSRPALLSLVTISLGLAAPTPAAAQGAGIPETHILIVSGLGGAPEYSQLFRSQAKALLEAARDRWGLSPGRAVWLAEDPTLEPGLAKDRSTREAVQREIGALAAAAGPDDAVLVLLLGHGAASGSESKLNLPGPDLSGQDLAEWLSAFDTQTVAVVNAASASGGFVPSLAGSRRIVVAATRTARERERTHFGSYFVDAFIAEGADADKDERVSLLEAFLYAKREVERFYERGNQMLTEHAILDDNGDGEGSAQPTLTGPDGALAGRFFLAAAPRAVAGRAATDPALAALLAKKAELEDDISTLRSRRDEMAPERYEARLEALLLELAATNRAIREIEGGR